MSSKLKTSFVAVALALCAVLLMAGCSSSEDGRTGENGSVESTNNDNGKTENSGKDEETAGDGTGAGSVMGEHDAYDELDEELDIPLFILSSVPEGYLIKKVLPEKPNPEILGDGASKEATLTYFGPDGNIVLTFGVQGDLGDVETKDATIAGYEAKMYEAAVDGKQRVYYVWSVDVDGTAVPYTLQFTGLTTEDADDLAGGLDMFETSMFHADEDEADAEDGDGSGDDH